MGRITYPTAAECRKSASVCRRLAKRYAGNWRVNVVDRQGGLSVDVTVQRVGPLQAKIATIDWFGFSRGVVKTTSDVAEEVDAVLEEIENRPLFTILGPPLEETIRNG